MRDRALRPDCGVASRRPLSPTDAHGLRRHFHGSLDAAWGDVRSACAEGPSVAFDHHLRWEAPQRAISRGGLGMSPIDTKPIERSVR